MRELRLVGLSADGRRVVLVDDAGNEFATPADDRLLAALRGDRARLGQLEIQMDSALRPRDIQARIRNGESPEAVAALAGVSVEKIMPYCVPVLAERQHIADLAGRSHVRRRNADGPARRLSEVVGERLRGRGINPDDTEWDAWRGEDGRWVTQASYRSGERQRTATFVFDAIGRYSLADDDEAKWLTGERQSTSKGPQPREPGSGAERRLSSVPGTSEEDLVTLAESVAPSDTQDFGPPGYDEDELSDDLTAVVRAVRELDRPSDRDSRGDDGHTAVVRDFRAPVQPTAETDAAGAGAAETDFDETDPDDTEPAVAESADTESAATEPADTDPSPTDGIETDEARAVPVAEPDAAAPGDEAARHQSAQDKSISDAEPSDAAAATEAATGSAAVDEAEASSSEASTEPVTEPVTEPTPERRRRNPRRASVPTWDEIMFGKGKSE